jgi:hypothetical protein
VFAHCGSLKSWLVLQILFHISNAIVILSSFLTLVLATNFLCVLIEDCSNCEVILFHMFNLWTCWMDFDQIWCCLCTLYSSNEQNAINGHQNHWNTQKQEWDICTWLECALALLFDCVVFYIWA